VFIGHYGVSLAAKRAAPRLSLGWLFLAVQVLDLLFFSFVLAGVEKLRLVPGFTEYNPYDLYFMPISHGLLGALGWSVLAALIARALLGRDGGRASLVIGACVLSHWLLDLPMHTRDLPLAGNDSLKVGFGLWNHRALSLAAELIALAAGAAVWLREAGRRGARIVFIAVLVVLLLATPFLPQPPSTTVLAVQALAGYLVLAGAAAWVDRATRRSATS
jgi:hypothetical protein